MRAAVVEELNKPLVVRNVPDPECPPDGAIVRVGANGICRTDWHLWTGDWAWRGLAIQPPFVLGHEFSGTIEEVGREVTGWKRGDRVIFPMNPGEGTCEWCLKPTYLRFRCQPRARRVVLGRLRRIRRDSLCERQPGPTAGLDVVR